MRHRQHSGLVALVLAIAVAAGCTAETTPAPSTAKPATPTDAPAEPQPSAAWEVVSEMEIEQPTRMAAFLDENTGFTGGAGDEGRAHKTTDGGKTWTLIESSKG